VKALIHVTLKADVLDLRAHPQRLRVARLHGHRGGAAGQAFRDPAHAAARRRPRALVEELCDKLLANPVIEDYQIVRLDP
jgi:phosphoribosylformylglycinamidine (FGAM) synthase PurS component